MSFQQSLFNSVFSTVSVQWCPFSRVLSVVPLHWCLFKESGHAMACRAAIWRASSDPLLHLRPIARACACATGRSRKLDRHEDNSLTSLPGPVLMRGRNSEQGKGELGCQFVEREQALVEREQGPPKESKECQVLKESKEGGGGGGFNDCLGCQVSMPAQCEVSAAARMPLTQRLYRRNLAGD